MAAIVNCDVTQKPRWLLFTLCVSVVISRNQSLVNFNWLGTNIIIFLKIHRKGFGTFWKQTPELTEKQTKAEYYKQYSLKRKLLIQQQDSTSSETELFRKQKKATHIIFTLISCILFTCDMYMCHLRYINDPVLSSLKMKGIRLLFNARQVYHPLRFA
jgi:hypothetical protein